MTTAAYLRIGSLEVLAALAVFGIIAARLRPDRTIADPPARRLAVTLTVNEPPSRGGARTAAIVLQENAPAVIGRSAGASVGVLDPEVSRMHGTLTLVKGGVYLEDAQSSNGTFLNGKRVTGSGIEIFAGDAIDVGTTRITVDEIAPA